LNRTFYGNFERNFYGAILFGVFIGFGWMCDGSAVECGSFGGNERRHGTAVRSGKCGGWFVAIYAKDQLKKLWFIALLSLSGCGVNGAPERPSKPVGLTINGEATVGIAKNGN